MRKFTFFLALMVTMITTAFAAAPEDAVTVVKTEVALTTVAGQPGYVSSPHDHAVINPNSQWDKGGVAALIDGDVNTHFHTAWENVPAGPHYFQIDMGEGNTINKFCFDYVARSGGSDDYPTEFTIKGSNDDAEYELVTVVDLSSAKQAGSKFSSAVLGGDKEYRYLRFEVTDTYVPNGSGYRIYFHAAEFDLYSVEEKVVIPEAEEIAARIAVANEALAFEGVGYPTAAPRATLQAAIDALNAEGSSSNYAALQSAIDAYYATTDVVLPEVGKAYTITMVAKNGNKFYLNYTGEDVAMTARTNDELPESAVYVCEAGDNGAVAMKTNDGKYLVYHSKYAGVDWLQNNGNTQGFQDAKDKMTNITFAKLVTGGNVAATNEVAFGKLAWYSMRGYDVKKNEDSYGYMVLKTDGSDYDGASAPFFNDNYSSAFLLEEVEIAVEPVEPLTVVSVTPSEAVESFSSITIEFNKDIVVDWGTSNEGTGGTGTATGGTGTATGGTGGTGTATGGATAGGTDATAGVSSIKVKDANGGNVTTIWTSQAVVVGNTITFKLESAIAKSGEYSVEIPAGCIKSVDGEEYAGETFTFTVDAAPTMTSKATVNVDNALSDITVEFDSEIEFAAESDVTVLNVYVKDTETVAATITVANNAVINGKVLTLTLDEVLAPECTTKYTVEIPAGWIVKMGSDKAFTGKKLTYTVKIPFVIKNFTPASGLTVEALENIVIEYNENLTTYGTEKTVLENVADNTQVEVTVTTNNNVATITPNSTVTSGTYKLVNLNYIVSNSSWTAPATLPEYTITVKEAATELPALEPTSTERNPQETAINGQYKLTGVKIKFGEIVKKYTTDIDGDYGYILDAEGNEVATLNRCMGGNGTSNDFATPYASTAIETPGTYKVVVKSGVILSADGTKEYKGGEFEFTVAERAVEISPSAEDGFCWNETYEKVADFSEFVITVKYAKSDVVINNEVKATMKTGDTVYEATVTVEKSGTTQYITLAFDGEFAEGGYTIDVPAGLYTVDGVANAAYAQSTFTYSKPQLEITRDFDTWESYLDSEYSMPTRAMITIANAESVEVDDTKVATIAVGENVYNSTVSYNYDDWSNAYYIELTFEDFFAEGFEFVKGDYTFTLPAGLYTVNGVANEEAVKAYTYGDPIIEEFTVTSVIPANGSTLESIDAIAITFSNGMKPDILPVTCGEKSYTFVKVSDVDYVPVDTESDPIVISEPGTYTLDLSELEGLTGDKVFSWTIPAPAPTLNETVVFDFANNNWGIPTMAENNYSNLKVADDYTDGTNTIHIDPTANNGSYIYDSKGFLNLGKTGSKIILPAFDFAVEKIEVVGHPSATSYTNVDMNVYVGDAAVSTACIGSTDTYTYEIAADNQAAGNVYELVIGSNGGNYSSIMYITYIKVYPAENKLEAPVIDLASGVYVGEQTVNAHSATTDIEGVTNVTYYYTTDGNEPTTEDEESVDGVITITNSCTLKVVVEFTLGEKTYVSASTSAEYIITEAATYHRAVAVEAGNYFLVADGYVSAPIEGTTLPAVEVTVDGNDATAPVYYAITLEEAEGGYYIKDVNGKYIYNTMMSPGKLSSGTYAPMDAWTIEIADDENSTATIKCNGYVLALNKGVFCTVQLGGTDVPVMPTLYGTHATGINEAVVNGEAIESIYDLTGRRVEKITKSGIYIVNGKKVLVK